MNSGITSFLSVIVLNEYENFVTSVVCYKDNIMEQNHENEVQSEENTRFGTEEDTSAFVQGMKNKNTSRKTASDLKLIQSYFLSLGEIRDVEDIPPADLNLSLARFFLNVRKSDGGEYEPDSLKGFQSSLARHLTDKNYDSNILIDKLFSHSRDVLCAKRKELKSKGKGNKPNKAEGLTIEDITLLYNKGQFGTGTALCLKISKKFTPFLRT